VGNALGLASLAGIAGALLVIVLGSRCGRNASMAMGTAVSLAAVWILLHKSGFNWFLLAAALVNLSWNYTFPYQMGTLALFDRHGTVAALSLVVQTFGLSLGPMLASFLLVGKDFSVILWVCQGLYFASFLMFFLSSHRGVSRAASLP
jgi:predicted MFS family arabinose efflux permease